MSVSRVIFKKNISPFLIWHTAEMKKEEEITVDLSYQ